MCLGLAPPQERRKEMTKVVSKLGEEGKVAIRWAERLTAAAADVAGQDPSAASIFEAPHLPPPLPWLPNPSPKPSSRGTPAGW